MLAQPDTATRPMGGTRGWVDAPRALIAAALLSGAIYAAYLAFVAYLPYHVNSPNVYLLDVLGWRASSRVLFAVSVLALSGAAAGAWWSVRRARESSAVWLWAIVPPVLFAILLTFTQPLFSRDFFHYIIEGRILGVHGSNPYRYPPAAFPNDPFFGFSNWMNYASPYGPLWVLLATGLTLLAGDDILWNVVLFKLVALVGYLACGALLWDLLRRLGRAPLPGLVLWLWNPLVLIELIGNGHNDVAALPVALLGFWLYLRGWARAGVLALTAAALVKYTALVLLPLMVWHRLRHCPGWWARAREAARLAWAPALLVVALLAPFWIGLDTLGFLRESDHYYSSVAHLARMGLEQFLHVHPWLSDRLVQGGVLLALLVGYPWLLWEAGGDRESLLSAAYHTMLLLLVLWTFFVPWYAAWAIPWAAALATRRAGRQALLLSGVALLSYVVQFYPRGGKETGVELRSTLSALLIFVPLLLSLLPWDRLRRSRRADPSGRGEDQGQQGSRPHEGSAE